VEAFATYTDLGLRLNRTFVGAEQAWITALLQDASTYLRDDVLGQQIYPQQSSTITVYPDLDGRVELPMSPVTAITSVTRNSVAVPYTRRDNTIWVDCGSPVSIVLTYGYPTIPDSLKRWCLVLTSQALIPLEQQLGLNAGGLSSVAIDDFKAAYADAGENSGITLSDRNIALLRKQFGFRGTTVVGVS
jgi:hypothetical protein